MTISDGAWKMYTCIDKQIEMIIFIYTSDY